MKAVAQSLEKREQARAKQGFARPTQLSTNRQKLEDLSSNSVCVGDGVIADELADTDKRC